ncbi:MAG: sulfatase-like hydrolase/transferase [Schleiferilactobacillus harbinensis]|jgi:phosphoglycerol transferase MdoB-like AlkP superfamily enzyme|nr:sulfatase-like hydrolase/transferase [Schleiferilactobacillus harbinensis]MCI1911540.1 sulfatase-like hydrolase/transferase [Schleiferilactobacillus harbinensis]
MERRAKQKQWIVSQLFIYISFIGLGWLATFGLTWSQANLDVSDALTYLGYQERAFWFTWFFSVLLFLALYGLFNRYYVAIGIGVGFFAVYTIANYLKMLYRNEPILPSDMEMITNIKELLSMLSWRIVVLGILGIGLLVAAIFALNRYVKFPLQPKMPIWVRPIPIVLLVAILLPFGNSNHNHSYSSQLVDKLQLYPNASSMSGAAQFNGPFLQFMANVDLNVMDKPKGYSKEKITSLVKKYQDAAEDINATRATNLQDYKQTVIYVLSESYANPASLPFVKLNHDPAPQIDKIMKTSPSGKMMSSGYGGGTANMEYMALTSFGVSNFTSSLRTPYTQLVTRRGHSFSINQLFDQSVAIHPYHGTLYSRTQVFEKFKFQHFLNMDNDKSLNVTPIKGHPYASDASAYSDALKVVKENSANKSQFIQLSTMQNHMPYTTKYAGGTVKASGPNLSADTLSQIDNYADGLTKTDTATKRFLDELDQIDRPITVLFYGDHLPGIYPGELMAQYGVQLHQADYFIYSNKTALEQAGEVTNTQVSAPNYFSPMVFARMNTEVTPYLALLTAVQEGLPAMSAPTNTNQDTNNVNLGNQWTDAKGQVVAEDKLTKDQKQLISDYRMIQYDETAGSNYARNLRFYQFSE